MSDAPLTEQLDLDLTNALASLDRLGEALDNLVTNFQTGLDSALSAVTSSLSLGGVTVDAASIGEEVTAALDAIPPPLLPVEADTSTAQTEIDSLDGQQLSLFTEADISPAQDSISALENEQLTLDITADTSTAQTAIDDLAVTPVEVPVEADTSDAEAAINDLGGSADKATGGVTNLRGGVAALDAAAGLAVGSAGGLKSAISGISTETGIAVGAGAAFTGFLAKVIPLAADAQAQTARFNATFGILADQVQHINVGGLNISLEDLGKQSGTTAANLDASASKIGLLGKSAGASGDQIVQTTDNILALAGALSVQNPRLGDAADVADRLQRALATGGRFAQQLGLSLQTADIKARAQEIAGAGNEVTRFDLVTAGAQLAVQQFGDTLGTTFQQGTQNAEIQLRALKTQVEETLVAIGQPLLGPLVETFQNFLPVAQALGIAFGNLLQAVLPLVAALSPALIPVADAINLVAKGITALESAVTSLSPTELIGIAIGLGAIAVSSGEAAVAVAVLAGAIDTALGPVGIAVGALALLGAAFGAFHTSTATVKVDAADLSKALLDTASAANTAAAASGNISDALATQLQKTLSVGPANQTALDGVNQLGLSFGELTKVLLGTNPAFLDFTSNLVLHASGSKDEIEAQLHLADALGQTRDQLNADATAALAAAVASGQLTQAQVDQAEQTSNGLPSLIGAITAYQQLKPVIDAATKATLDQSIAQGSLQEAFLALKPAIADGTTTVADAQSVADQLGISANDAKAAIESLTKAMDAFVTTGLNALPQASAALDDFQKNIDSAFAAVAQAGPASVSSAITSAATSVTTAQDAANQAIAAAGDRTAATVDQARQKLAEAQARQQADQQSNSTVTQTQLAADARAVQSAQDALTRAEQNGAISQANAISQGGLRVQSARDALSKAQADQADKAKKAQDDLIFALDPQRVIDAENKNILSIVSFQKNLETLISRGRDDVVALLVAEGPAKGAQLAEALVNDDVKAKALNTGVQMANSTTEGYRQFLEAHKAELSGRLITLANGQTVDLTNTFSAIGGQVGEALSGGLDKALLEKIPGSIKTAEGLTEHGVPSAVAAVANTAEQAGKAATGAFTDSFRVQAPANAEVAKVAPTIANHIPEQTTEAATASGAITNAFTNGLDFTRGLSSAFTTFTAELDKQAAVAAVNANAAGDRIGKALIAGFAGALSAPGGVPSLTTGSAPTGTTNVPNTRTPLSLPTGTGTPAHTSSVTESTKQVNVAVSLHKTDPDPFQLAQEIGFAVG